MGVDIAASAERCMGNNANEILTGGFNNFN